MKLFVYCFYLFERIHILDILWNKFMRIKKQSTQINQKNNQTYKIIKAPLLYSVSLFLFLLVFIKLGYSRFSYSIINPIPWGEFLRTGILKAFFISLGFFIALYFWKIKVKKPIREKDVDLNGN